MKYLVKLIDGKLAGWSAFSDKYLETHKECVILDVPLWLAEKLELV